MRPPKPIRCEKIFGNNVRACREALNLSQKELAEGKLGYPEELIRKIEEGCGCECSVGFYVALFNFFEVPLEKLLTNPFFTPYDYEHFTAKECESENEV